MIYKSLCDSVGGGYRQKFFVNSESLRDSVGGGGSSAEIFLFRDLKTSFFVNGALFFFYFPEGGARAPPESATVWGQYIIAKQVFPSPSLWGWVKSKTGWVPFSNRQSHECVD